MPEPAALAPKPTPEHEAIIVRRVERARVGAPTMSVIHAGGRTRRLDPSDSVAS